jgi:hypothetical protein
MEVLHLLVDIVRVTQTCGTTRLLYTVLLLMMAALIVGLGLTVGSAILRIRSRLIRTQLVSRCHGGVLLPALVGGWCCTNW